MGSGPFKSYDINSVICLAIVADLSQTLPTLEPNLPSSLMAGFTSVRPTISQTENVRQRVHYRGGKQ